MLASVLKAYNIDEEKNSITTLSEGLINHTWKIETNGHAYILQKINQSVFQNPADIAFNISLIENYLKEKHPDYLFISPILTEKGEELFTNDNACYRVFPFVKNSHTKKTVSTPQQAYEAALQFGRFTNKLKNFDTGELRITIPSFHDLSLRYKQFLKAVETGNPERISTAASTIEKLKLHSSIAEEFDRIVKDESFKKRVTHHDTKISNVLFDDQDKGICVIDLDTVMPGYFISDVGDMMRTYLCPVSEEGTEFDQIHVRKEIYDAIYDGYMQEMSDELSENEKKHFHYAGQFMIYMQALRFLTDYLQDDIYYGAKYPDHNLNRAINQATLLEKLMEIK